MKNSHHFLFFFVVLLSVFSLNIGIVSADPVLSISFEDNQKANIIIENCTEEIIGFSILLDLGQACDNFSTASDDFTVLSAQVNNSNNIVVKGITASDLKGMGLKLFTINSSCNLTQLKILNATVYGHGKEWLIQNAITQTVIKESPYESGAPETTPSLSPTSSFMPIATPIPTTSTFAPTLTPTPTQTPTSSPTTPPIITPSSLPSPSPTLSPSQHWIPGFESAFAIAGLLVVAYLVLRRRKQI